MAETFELNETLSLTPSEAALALHALRLYADGKGSNLSVDTRHLEDKLNRFIKSRELDA